MKKQLKYSSLFVLVLTLSACSGSDSTKTAVPRSIESTVLGSKYSPDSSGLILQWTAYKFTEKLGVSGTFDDCSLKLKNDSGTIEELLADAELTLSTKSVNSNNELRDPKLRADFFNVFNTEIITARILSMNQGQGVLELKMNGMKNDVEYDYSNTNDTLILSTQLNLLLWEGKEAMDSLNRVCYDLHKGADGISKLWPDVAVSFKLPIH